MIMVQECRLRLVGNSASVRLGGLCGRRCGGVIAPLGNEGSKVLVLSNCPATANETVVRRLLIVSNPRKRSAVARAELGVGGSPQVAMGSSEEEKGAKTNPPMTRVNCYAIVATA